MRRKTHRASRKLSNNRRRNTFKRRRTYKKRKTYRERGGSPTLELPYEPDPVRDPEGHERLLDAERQSRINTECDALKSYYKEKAELEQKIPELEGEKLVAKGKKAKGKVKGKITTSKNLLRDVLNNISLIEKNSNKVEGFDSTECLGKSDDEEESFGLKKALKNASFHGTSLKCHGKKSTEDDDVATWLKEHGFDFPRVTGIKLGKKNRTAYVVNIFPSKSSEFHYNELSKIIKKLKKIPHFKKILRKDWFITSRFKSRYSNCIARIKEINGWLTIIKDNNEEVKDLIDSNSEKWITGLSRLMNGDKSINLGETELEDASYVNAIEKLVYLEHLEKKLKSRDIDESIEVAYEVYNILQDKIKISRRSTQEDIKIAGRFIGRVYHPDKLDQRKNEGKLEKRKAERLKKVYGHIYEPAKEILEAR